MAAQAGTTASRQLPTDAMTSRYKALLPLVAIYVLLSGACLLAPSTVPAAWIRACLAFLWLLGPPATLLHGTGFAWAFGVGTAAFVPPFLLAVVGRSRASRIAGGLLAAVVWALAGCLVYAPAA